MKNRTLIMVMFVAFIGGLAAAGLVRESASNDPAPSLIRAHWAELFEQPRDLVRGVDAIVVAQWVGSAPGRVEYEDDGSELPFTLNTFRVERALKGNLLQGQSFELEQTGGRVDEAVYSIDDGGPYNRGRHLLFLKEQPDTGYFYLVNSQGRYGLLRGLVVAVDPDDPVAAHFHQRQEAAVVQEILSLLR